jgi:site-specific DNA-methyltransferase (adenine-specific)/modification methylase
MNEKNIRHDIKKRYDDYDWITDEAGLRGIGEAGVRVERIGETTLYLGDCLEVLPTLGPVDAVITDPPYGMKYKGGPNSRNSISSTGKMFHTTVRNDDKLFDPIPWLKWPCVFTGAQWFYHLLPPGGGLHCWDKRGNYQPLDQADADIVWTSQRLSSRVFHLVWRGLCRHSENKEPILHPTQKPIALMKWCLGFLPDARTILDPFMGSGTTGVACANLGRRFIGIEIEPHYFDIACRRIRDAYAQPRLPLEEPKQVQPQELGL